MTEPAYSIIVPAYNEEAILPDTLGRVAAAMTAVALPGEIVVVDNNSDDRTAAVARAGGARVVHEPHNQIARARNTGARCARGNWFLFLDADTQLTGTLLQAVAEQMGSGDVCGGGAAVAFDRPLTGVPKWILGFWNSLAARRRLAAGAFFYCTRQAFEAVGGFNERVYASEEIWLSRRLRLWGREHGQDFVIIPEPKIVTSSRKLDWYSASYILGLSLLLAVCPFLLYSRFACRFWYTRPDRPKDA